MRLIPFAMIAVLSVSVSAVPGQDTSKVGKPWNAADDMKSLQGRWKVSNVFNLAKPSEDTALAAKLLKMDTVIRIEGDKLAVEGTSIGGPIRNDHNKIAEIPAIWSNTMEPKLTVKLDEKQSITVSYVVHNGGLLLRYPANSCSRTGARISLKLVTD